MNTFILIINLLFNALVEAKDQATLFLAESRRSTTTTLVRTVCTTPTAKSTEVSVAFDALTERSDDLYTLRVPIDD
jgi:hypothetical protein